MGIFDLFPPFHNPDEPTEPKLPGLLLGHGDSDPEPVHLPPEIRINHLYIIGLPRYGKTEMMKNLMIQDATLGNNFAFIDPHGEGAEQMLGLIPKERVDDVIYFDPSDPQSPSFNVMKLPFAPHKLADDIVSVFRMFFTDSWGPRLEHIMRYALLTLLMDGNHTLADLKRILFDEEYRQSINIPKSLESFWHQEFVDLPKNSLATIANKLSLILMPGSPQQRIFSTLENNLDFEKILNGKILIANLAKGLLGTGASHLIGGFIVAGLQQAALARASVPPEKRTPFYLYVDEFQNFTINSFNEILTESPKYKMYLTMAHQFMSQIPEDLKHAISGTVGTRVAFQIADEDAQRVKSIMNVNRMLWRKGGDWEPIITFKDYAIAHLERNKRPELQKGVQDALRKAQTAFSPTQLREVAKAHVDWIDGNGAHRREFLFDNIQIEQEEFPEKYELQNLPKYTAFVRLGDNRHVYRITTVKCPEPDKLISHYILTHRPQRKPTVQVKVQDEISTPDPLDEPKTVKMKGNGIRDDSRRAPAEYPGDITDEQATAPRRKADKPKGHSKSRNN